MRSIHDRPLGATEQALWLRDRAVPLHFALTAQIRGTLTPQRLRPALDRLQQRHPLLRVKIELDHQPHFVEQIAPIPCRVLHRQGEQHWQSEVLRELEQPFVWTEAPLVRIALIQGLSVSELILVCHHAIADGLSAVTLIQELLTLLDQPDQTISKRATPSSLESLLPQSISISNLQLFLARVILRLRRFNQPAQPGSNQLQLSSGTLSPTVTTALIQRCRQEDTTVHSAICTALLFALAIDQNKTTLKCFSPINVRPYLRSHSSEDCGLYISPAQTTHAIASDSQFWQMARLFKTSLKLQTNENHLRKLAQQTELLMATQPDPNRLQQIFLEQYDSDVMVTNLGQLSTSQQFGSLKLEAIYGSAVLSGFSTERVLGVATLGNQLYFTFVYSAHQLSSTTTPDLAQQAMRLIESAISASDLSLSTARDVLSQISIEYALKY